MCRYMQNFFVIFTYWTNNDTKTFVVVELFNVLFIKCKVYMNFAIATDNHRLRFDFIDTHEIEGT